MNEPSGAASDKNTQDFNPTTRRSTLNPLP